MIIPWPAPLVLDVARRRSALVLGSGISSQAHTATGRSPKRWQPFLEAAKRRLAKPRAIKAEIQKLLDKRDYLTACQVLKDEMGGAIFSDLLTEEFLTPQYIAGDIHDSVIALDSRLVISPNFDKIYETRANALAHGSVRVKQYHSIDVVEAIRSPLPVIIKKHGSVDEPARVIFTRNDYAAAREQNKDFYSIMDALALTHTFVFLGCGMDDPDVRLMLEGYAFRHRFGRPHYFVMGKGSIGPCVARVVQTSMNVQVLEYDSTNHHVKLKTAIDELKQAVDGERLTIRDNMSW